MKAMKKIAKLLISLFMTVAMSTAVFAAGSNTITIKEDGKQHVYEVYQVLKGTVDGEELTNIQWGANITSTENAAAVFADVDANTKVTVNTTDNTLTLGNKTLTLTGTADEIRYNQDNGYTLTDVEDGYYVIIDVANQAGGLGDDAYSAGIVKVVGNVTVTPKSATPTVDKQVKDETGDAETGSTDGWGETADHAMYETYQYKLVATLPNDVNLDEYEHYYLQFKDTLSKGVTYAGNMTITVTDSNGTSVSVSVDVASNAVDGTTGPAEFTVTIQDLTEYVTDLKGAVVTVTYDAYLNNDAVIGNEDDNQNTVSLEYSNNPAWDGNGTPETGETGPDTVFVFTYKVDNTKIDGTTEAPLAGAEFKLYADEECTTEIGLFYDEKLSAYRPVTAGETATVMTSDKDGVFNIKGVDAGTYYLKETKAPTGYNLLTDAITIVIEADHSEAQNGASATTTISQEKSQNMENEVKNFNGTTLPETGGFGTTMFYVFGSILAVVAGVLLVTRRRMAE